MQHNPTPTLKVPGLRHRLQKAYFDLSYRLGFAEWDVKDAQPSLAALVRGGKLRGPRVLDLGCRSGDNAIYLAQQGFQVTGIDYSERGIEVARRRAVRSRTEVVFAVADAFELTAFRSQFDAVIDYGLYHNIQLERIEAYLEQVSRVLVAGGQFIIQSFGPTAPKSQFGPRRISEQEIRTAFRHRWVIEAIESTVYENKAGVEVPAILSLTHLITH